MSSYACPSSVPLPTIAEIEASTEELSIPGWGAKVVRVKERFAVKYGPNALLSEAASMGFLAGNTNVPVPRVYAAFVEAETNHAFIVMDYIPGDNLQTLLPSLTSTEKDIIGKMMRDAITELREIPSEGYLGTMNYQPYYEGVLATEDNNPLISGPFATQKHFNAGMLRKVHLKVSGQDVRPLQKKVNCTLHGHRTVFAHGDLQPRNIIVERLGYRDGGTPKLKITFVDWEMAGWYPEYWEFGGAKIESNWIESFPVIMDYYPAEDLVMQDFWYCILRVERTVHAYTVLLLVLVNSY